MKRFSIDSTYDALCEVQGHMLRGEVRHVARNVKGNGRTETPICDFYGFVPDYEEGFERHWRINCYVREHALAPDPESLGRTLISALMAEGICSEPLFGGWYSVGDGEGAPWGQVFEED